MKKYGKARPRSERSLFIRGASSIGKDFHFRFSSEYDLVFRLCMPSGRKGKWVLDYFMRSKNDPGIIYPVSVVLVDGTEKKGDSLWSLRLHTLSRISLAGKHSAFAPVCEDNALPLRLGSEEAYEFITEDALLLRDAGFPVTLPEIRALTGPPGIVMRPRNPDSFSGRTLSVDSRFPFDYLARLGDAVVSREKLLAYAKNKSHLVKVNDEWVLVDPAVTGKIAGLIGGRRGVKSVREAASFALSAAGAGVETFFDSHGVLYGSVLEALDGNRVYEAVKAPEVFTGSLRPYQERGVGWMRYMLDLGLGALLADDMGLGKTVQVIAYALLLKERGEGPFLVVCPTSVLGNWAEEFEKFAPSLRVAIHHGNERSEGKGFRSLAASSDVLLTSYSLAWRDAEDFSSVEWALMVADEAQNIKNPTAKKSRSLRSIPARRRLALTGTPIENRLSDIWSIMEYVNPGYLPSKEKFRELYAKPVETCGDVERKDALRNALSPFILRRLKTDKKIITDLPEKIEKREWCSLTAEQARLYREVASRSIREIGDGKGPKRRMTVLAALTHLKQICNHPANYLKEDCGDYDEIWETRSGKVGRLAEIVDTVLEGEESCLVFSQYAQTAKMLKGFLERTYDVPVNLIHGGVKRTDRETILGEFRSRKEPQILVLSLRAGGTGLNLAHANNVIHFDRWWNPAVENQATDRSHRIGQKRNVYVHKMLTKGTIEENIEKMLEEKKELADAIIRSGENILANLSTEKLRELLEYTE